MIKKIIISSLLFAVAFAIDGFGDGILFHRNWNEGYWTLTWPVKSLIGNDIWHDTKLIKMLMYISGLSIGIFGFAKKALYLIVGLAIINWLAHEVVLHYLM